jgi:hypothetical protein
VSGSRRRQTRRPRCRQVVALEAWPLSGAGPDKPREAVDSTISRCIHTSWTAPEYLTAEESAALERASIETGKTRSQLIREAIDEKYGTRQSLDEFMAALNGAFGLWANPEGEAAVNAIHAARRAEARRTRARLRRLLGPDDTDAHRR